MSRLNNEVTVIRTENADPIKVSEPEKSAAFDFFEKHAVTMKLLMVMFVILLLLIPKSFVEGLVAERQKRKCETYTSVAKGWGKEQRISGPVLYVPVVYARTVEKKKETKTLNEVETETEKETITTVKYLHILPEAIKIRGKLNSQRKNKSIYEFILFDTYVDVSGVFTLKSIADYSPGEGSIKWDEAFIVIGISSMQGIKETVKMEFDEEMLIFGQGITKTDIFETGLNAKIKLRYQEGKELKFTYSQKLNGSGSLKFLPAGKETRVELDSEWPDPNFHGSFLPAEKSISESGFKAGWHVIDLNRNYPQDWICGDHKAAINDSEFGVSLAYPVDDYRKISRAVKYLILFLSLTFLTFFLAEVISKKKVHFVQYLLVGFSLIIFFVLLLSISEHIDFLSSYIISSASTIILIVFYSSGIMKSRKFGFIIGSALTVLYLFLYVLLLNQDYSLLFGSIGLFIALAVTMLSTRNTDWYNMKVQDKEKVNENN